MLDRMNQPQIHQNSNNHKPKFKSTKLYALAMLVCGDLCYGAANQQIKIEGIDADKLEISEPYIMHFRTDAEPINLKTEFQSHNLDNEQLERIKGILLIEPTSQVKKILTSIGINNNWQLYKMDEDIFDSFIIPSYPLKLSKKNKLAHHRFIIIYPIEKILEEKPNAEAYRAAREEELKKISRIFGGMTVISTTTDSNNNILYQHVQIDGNLTKTDFIN